MHVGVFVCVGVCVTQQAAPCTDMGKLRAQGVREITGELQGGYLREQGGPVTGLFAGVEWMY